MSSLSVYHVSSPEIPNKVLTHLEDLLGIEPPPEMTVRVTEQGFSR